MSWFKVLALRTRDNVRAPWLLPGMRSWWWVAAALLLSQAKTALPASATCRTGERLARRCTLADPICIHTWQVVATVFLLSKTVQGFGHSLTCVLRFTVVSKICSCAGADPYLPQLVVCDVLASARRHFVHHSC